MYLNGCCSSPASPGHHGDASVATSGIHRSPEYLHSQFNDVVRNRRRGDRTLVVFFLRASFRIFLWIYLLLHSSQHLIFKLWSELSYNFDWSKLIFSTLHKCKYERSTKIAAGWRQNEWSAAYVYIYILLATLPAWQSIQSPRKETLTKNTFRHLNTFIRSMNNLFRLS